MYASFCHFYPFFHTCPIFLGLQRLSTFFSFKSHNPETFMSSMVNGFVHAVRKRSQKVPCTKWDINGLIPMNQPQFCSSCVALQYETGTKFFHQAVPELCNIKIRKTQHNRVVFVYFFSLCMKCFTTLLGLGGVVIHARESSMHVVACSSLRGEQMGHYCCFFARTMLGLGGDKRLSIFKMTLSEAPLNKT